MTRNRHLTRTAVFTTASALLAVVATGTAAAWTRSTTSSPEAAPVAAAPVAAPASGTAAPGVVVAAKASAPAPRATDLTRVTTSTKATTTTTAPTRTTTATRPAPTKKTTTAAKPAPAKKTTVVTIGRYTYAPGSQRAIDQCKLVLWSTRPMWLAAHNYCGYQWLASVPTGRTIKVTSGTAAGTYVVTGHLRLGRQGGTMPSVKADLVLQTCVGSGTGLTLARRIR